MYQYEFLLSTSKKKLSNLAVELAQKRIEEKKIAESRKKRNLTVRPWP